MEPRLLEIWGDPPDTALLKIVARHITGGGLVAMPTETVYGFGCVAEGPPVAKLQRLKGRGSEKPFLVLIPDVESVGRLAWTPQAREFARVFWPGALTLVLRDPEAAFPPGIRSARGTVAVRMTPHPLARALVRTLGRPLVSTSANPPAGLPALSAEEAWETARSLGAGPDLWVLDGGRLQASEPSTLIDCSGPEPSVLRAGAIPVNRLRCVLPEIHESS